MIKINNLDEAAGVIASAMSAGQHLGVQGLATKAALGRSCVYDDIIDVSALCGIVDYQPEELILTLRAGTPMDEVEAVVAAAGQMLAFEVPDFSTILNSSGPGTIGGVIGANLSGPRRLTAGAARDYLLGFAAVSGRGEAFKSGGKVMKNVTGYDLSKLICGSFGTLAIVDEITIKTLPRPETAVSLLFACDDLSSAIAGIAHVFASPHEPGAAAILPAVIAEKTGVGMNAPFVVVIRIEGIAVSVADRAGHILAGGVGQHSTDKAKIDATQTAALWQAIRDVELLGNMAGDIWKLSCPPSSAPAIIAVLEDRFDMQFFADWAGGLLWISGPSRAEFGLALRAALATNGGGFAQFFRASGASGGSGEAGDANISPFQPLSPAHYALHKRVKAAFDPLAVLNFGRMHNGI